MNFGDALTGLRNGHRVHRLGWNGRGMWLALVGDGVTIPPPVTIRVSEPIRTLPFILMRTAVAEYVPWLASQTDILADDWQVVEEGTHLQLPLNPPR